MSVGEFAANLRDYDFFVEVYDNFRNAYGLTNLNYREVDWYLWGSYKDGEVETEIEREAKLAPEKYREYQAKEIKKTITIKD